MKLNHLFSRPSSKVRDPIEQKRAALLANFLLFRGFAFLALFTFVALITKSGVMDTFMALFMNMVAYGLARTKYYRWGAILVIGEGLTFLPYAIISNPTIGVIAAGPLWLGLGPLLSSLVLPTRHTIGIIFATMISFIVILAKIDPVHLPIVGGIFVFTMASSVLTLVGTYLRDKANEELELEKAKVLQVSKLSALGEMAAGVAHEINTPLAAIILNAEMMQLKMNKSENPDPDLIKRTNSIVEISERAAKIIKGLKDVSRDAYHDERTEFALSQAIQSATDLCLEKFKSKGVQLIIEQPSFEQLVYGQNVQVSQTILNLLNNSFDSVQELPNPWIKISAKENKNFIELRITDCGKPIASDILEKIFLPFFTTKGAGKGTGLGLSISKSIIEKQGGELFYDKTSPHVCFVIQLPKARSQKVG